eukprot:scaffold190266_cov23-Tisochrysis_lutea.AAC.1
MRSVDRAIFIPQGLTPKVSQSYQYGPYADAPQSLGFGVTVSAPHAHATALEALAEVLVAPGTVVLDVGSGSGILLAYMARFRGEAKRIVGLERIEPLVALSVDNLRRAGFEPDAEGALRCPDTDGTAIIVRHGDGWDGAAELGPFDAIHVGAYASEPPEALLRQLRPGGRMVIPLGSRTRQQVYCIDKTASGDICSVPLPGHVRYVPLVEPQPPKPKMPDGEVDWDARYRRGWAYGKEPNAFVVEVARRFLVAASSAVRAAEGAGAADAPEETSPDDGATSKVVPPSGRPLEVLSLGEGQGRNGVYLASLGHRVTAVDLSPVGLAKASRLAAERGVPEANLCPVVANLEDWTPPPDTFDVVLS